MRKPALDPFPFSLFSGLKNDSRYRAALFELGIFEKNLSDDTGFLCTIWKKWGYTPEELRNGLWERKIHTDDLQEVLEGMEAVKNGKTDTFRQEYRILTKGRDYRWVLNQGIVITRDQNGFPVKFIGTDVDITNLKKTQEDLIRAKMEAEQRAQEAESLRIAGTIIASSLDIQEAVNLVLEQAMLLVPYDVAAVFTVDSTCLELIGLQSSLPDKPKRGSRFPVHSAEFHRSVLVQSVPVIYPDRQEPIPELGDSHEPVYSWMGVPLAIHSRVTGLLTFVSQKRFSQKHLHLANSLADHVSVALNNARQHQGTLVLATIDPLTNTYTRRWFFSQAEMIFRQAVLKEHELSVLMIDIDNFKPVNDCFGHTIGDIILHRVSQACMLGLRGSDIIGRYGGEEFAILLPGSGAKEALLVAERLRRNVETLTHDEIDRHVTVSVGICTYAGHESLSGMIQAADIALYRAKETGRNRVCSNISRITLQQPLSGIDEISEKK